MLLLFGVLNSLFQNRRVSQRCNSSISSNAPLPSHPQQSYAGMKLALYACIQHRRFAIASRSLHFLLCYSTRCCVSFGR